MDQSGFQQFLRRQGKKAIANQSPHKFAWYTGDPAHYNARLAGKTIRAAAATAGEVEIKADEMQFILSASLHYQSFSGNRTAPGLGNGVLQDILWTAQIHRKRKMDSLFVTQSSKKRHTWAAASISALIVKRRKRNDEKFIERFCLAWPHD